MNSRALASIALGAAVLLGTTGCSMISPQATKIEYAAAEGINVPSASGPVDIRNLYFVVGEDDSASLIGAFVNPTGEDQRALLSIADGENLVVEVPAGDVVSYGVEEHKTVESFTAKPGSMVEVAFTSGEGQTTTVGVPVLDGTLEYLQDSVPTAPAPTASPSATN